jgi:membrane protein DedA with SNARE-associated domain
MLIDQLLSAFALYGLPVLFGALLIGAVGIPMPASLMLLAAGSFVAQGDLSFWSVLALASLAAILGDNVGYCIGRCGGRRVVLRVSQRIGGEERLLRAEEWTRRWGWAGIFFSRWLVTPLGSWVNLASGLGLYSWPRFLFLVVAGEMLWVALYVVLGKIFSDQVLVLSEFLGDLTWSVVGLFVAFWLGRKLLRYISQKPASLNANDAHATSGA